MRKIAIFASGGGSNAEAIIQHFKDSALVQVALIVTNKSTAGVIARADNHQLPYRVINRSILNDEEKMLPILKDHNIDFIVLAGWLQLIPSFLVKAYKDSIVNIHPALLPAYGGKGMYGMHVHRAVKENKEMTSGMTIHLVNEEYDEGKHLFQASTLLDPTDSPEDIAAKVLKLEHKYYPKVIEYLISN